MYGDTIGDACDECPGEDDRIDLNENGISDCTESAGETDPCDISAGAKDSDGDGKGDACEKSGGPKNNRLVQHNNWTSPVKLKAFPNPFTRQLTLRFYLPDQEKITLEVFNLQGQRVRTLTAGNWETGEHELYWEAETDNGQLLPPGLYVIRLTAGQSTHMERVMLQR